MPQLRFLIAQGQRGVDVIGDSPTMAMLDPDHPHGRARHRHPGRVAVLQAGLHRPFARHSLDAISVSGSLPSIFAVAGLQLAAKEAGVPLDRLRGSVLQVPLYAEDCSYAVHMQFDLRVRMAADVMAFCAAAMPRFHGYVEDTYFFSEVGLTAVDEMALGFVEIRYLVREMLKRGVAIDAFAPRIAILVNCGMDFFEEIAKMRATRRLFARMMRDEFGAADPRSWSAVITSHTSGLSMTAQQPANNIVRGALQALALVLGGAQAIEISAFDEAMRTPSREAHLVSLRTQQIIELESGAGNVADPLGGSHYVECLTDEMERRIVARIGEIEALGDPSRLADGGWFRAYFRQAMERHADQVESGATPVVGLNVLKVPPDEDRLLKDIAESRHEPRGERVERIRAFRRARDGDRVEQSLRSVLETAQRPARNLVPAVTGALDAGATLGEIAGTLRLGYGQPYDPFGMVDPPGDLA